MAITKAKMVAHAPEVLSFIRDLVADMPESISVTDFSSKRYDALKVTTASLTVDLGQTKLSFTLDVKDAE